MAELVHRELTGQIIDAAMTVHRELGPGLLESAYEACIAHVLAGRGIAFERQKILPVNFQGQTIDCGYRLDLVVEQQVIVELKSVNKIERIHEAQLMTYLKLSRLRVGLLLNFNSVRLRDGIIRRVV
jgi:GxxExxY protein